MTLVAAVFWAAASAACAAQAPSDAYWMKRYPLRAYGALWHLELEVEDFTKGRAEVERVLAVSKGTSTVAAQNQVGSDKVKYMQWSYTLARAGAEDTLERLAKVGTVKRRLQNENLQPEVTEEVPAKRARLKAERDGAGPVLERLPASSAAVAEILAHLEAVEKAAQASQDVVLLNLSLEETK